MEAPTILVTGSLAAPRSLRRYLAAVEAAGAAPLAVLAGETPPAEALARLADAAGLVLTGGADVDPAFYGDAREPATEVDAFERDALERALVEDALARDLAVFAICRGFQLLNVALGGSLLQDIPGGAHRDVDGRSAWATVHVDAASPLAAITGERPWVNHRHHQAVTPARLASAVVPWAWSGDGELVEAGFVPGRRWVCGVQWHPERDEEHLPGPDADAFRAASRALFRRLVEAAAVRTETGVS